MSRFCIFWSFATAATTIEQTKAGDKIANVRTTSTEQPPSAAGIYLNSFIALPPERGLHAMSKVTEFRFHTNGCEGTLPERGLQ
eukprot:3303929-Amphidinium_carterae.1